MFGISGVSLKRKSTPNSASKSTGEIMGKVSIGLVGAGYWGKKLLPKFVESAEGLIKAVCDIHPDHRAEINQSYPDIPTTDSYEKILSDPNIAAVILARSEERRVGKECRARRGR